MRSVKRTAELRLEIGNGIIFTGESFGAEKSVSGEVVFYTGMTGYTEAFTDPSYTGQILVLTYPLAGNYGVPERTTDKYNLPVDFESDRICIAGLVVSSYCSTPSHFNNRRNLGDWLTENGIPAMWNVDTRAVTKQLREYGTAAGSIRTGNRDVTASSQTPAELCKTTISEITPYGLSAEKPVVALLDCGTKTSIIRNLLALGLGVHRVPFDHSLNNVSCSGILISNGPGDPEQWTETIDIVRDAMEEDIPIFGICLGHQIIALASGASTEKMKYGHRSQNQPCIEENSSKPAFLLTSQNHGYQVTRDSLTDGWKVWFTNVNDRSVEGIKHEKKPVMGVQFHPESSPGPDDAAWIFREFAEKVFDYFRKTEGGV